MSNSWDQFMASAEEANHGGEPIQAQKYWVQAVKQAEDVKDFRRVGLTLDRMAEALRQQGNFVDAEGVLKMSLEVKEELFGKEHSEIISCLSNLVDALHAQKKFDEATEPAQRLINAYQETFGAEHPGVASIAVNMATVYHQISHPAAEAFYKQAIAIKTKTLGYRDEGSHITDSKIRFVFLTDIGRSEDANKLTENSADTVSGLWKTLAAKMNDRSDKLSDSTLMERKLHDRRRDQRS